MIIGIVAGHMKRRKSAYLKTEKQLEIEFAVTTAQVLHVARKLEGHNWATSEIANGLAVKEYKVRAAVSWLASQKLVKKAGEEKRKLRNGCSSAKYDVTIYTITEAGMNHEYVTSHRESVVGHFGDVAALEMALGFCRAFIR